MEISCMQINYLTMQEKMLEVYLNLFSDFGFKKIFGEPRNSSVLIDFLNAVLQPDKLIVQISYMNSEQLGVRESDRKSVFDIHCKDEVGNIFIIEIQRLKEEFFKDRSIYYSMFPISSQGKKGEWNYELKKTFTICIMDFCFDDTHPDHMIHEVKLIETTTHEVFCDRLMFWYIEMPKFKKQEHELINRQDKWFYVINNMHKLYEIPISLADDPIFKNVFMDAETAKLMEAELHAYIASRKAEWDAFAVKETAIKEGRKEGMAQGITQGMAQGITQGITQGMLLAAENMLKKGIGRQLIHECTGVSLADIDLMAKKSSGN